jgi:hypothetical protein
MTIKNKALHFFFFAGSAAFLLAVCSCGTAYRGNDITKMSGWSTGYNKSNEFITIVKKETIPLVSERAGASPVLTMEYVLLDTSNMILQFVLNKSLYEGQSASNYYTKCRYNLKTEYYDNIKLFNAGTGAPFETYNWTYNEIFSGIVFPKAIVVLRNREYYKGGAHGMHERKYFVFDTVKMSQMALEDIVKRESFSRLQEMIAAALRSAYKCNAGSSLSSLGFFADAVPVTTNFYISNDGLSFSWDPAEIAPYYFGIIDVTLPYTQIQNYLTENSKSIINSL